MILRALMVADEKMRTCIKSSSIGLMFDVLFTERPRAQLSRDDETCFITATTALPLTASLIIRSDIELIVVDCC